MMLEINPNNAHFHSVSYGRHENLAITIVLNLNPIPSSIVVNDNNYPVVHIQNHVSDPISIRNAYNKYGRHKITIQELRNLYRDGTVPSIFLKGKWHLSESALKDWLIRNRPIIENESKEVQRKKDLVAIHKERLKFLELQAARTGASTAPEILIEIEEIKQKIKEIEQSGA